MPIQPLIDEPSNPNPSSNVPASSVSIANEQCCQLPSISTNLRSSISASCFLANLKTSSGVIGSSCLSRGTDEQPVPFRTCGLVECGTAHASEPVEAVENEKAYRFFRNRERVQT